MNEIEKFRDYPIRQSVVSYEGIREPSHELTPSALVGVLRRWYIVLIVFIAVFGIGLPTIWILMSPYYTVTGALRVAPILPNIFTGDTDEGVISNYNRFMQTQAAMIVSERVVQRVADDLTEKNLDFFDNYTGSSLVEIKQKLKGSDISHEPVTLLKGAISSKKIQATPDRDTELILVSMVNKDAKEARVIVDSFIKNYMSVEVANLNQQQNEKIQLLENERKRLATNMDSIYESIYQLAQEYGSTALTNRQQMMMERVSALLSELTKVEAQTANLEAKVELLKNSEEKSIPEYKLLQMQTEYINSNPAIQHISEQIVMLEQELIQDQQRLTSSNPVLEQKQNIITAFQTKLKEKRKEIADEFVNTVAKQRGQTNQEMLTNAKNELDIMREYEKRLRSKINNEDIETRTVGRLQLDIEKLQKKLASTEIMYSTIDQRIKELTMEQKQPARVSIAYDADISNVRDKRVKHSAALFFFALTCGAGLAFLNNQKDKNLYSPQDVSRYVGTRILGTTASYTSVKKAELPEQIQHDYDTICANIGLLKSDELAKALVVTSPGLHEGKTTFAVNLATSLSNRGNKVLLIDGDLRKPDIPHLLKLPRQTKGLTDFILGEPFDHAVHRNTFPRIDVLASGSKYAKNAASVLLEVFDKANYINMLNKIYRYIIIDTPPALAFPDAMLWAKIAGNVILVSLAGHTNSDELKEVKRKLTEIHIEVFGTVLGNVQPTESNYYYAYNQYCNRSKQSKKHYKRATKLLLSTYQKE